MSVYTAIVAAAAFVSTALLTGVFRRLALRRGLLDVPNDRSSHQVPTPRGGGTAIVLSTLAGWLVLLMLHLIEPAAAIALAGGGIAVAIVGMLDDRYQLPAPYRLGVHCAAALGALFCLGGLPPLLIGTNVLQLGWTGYVLGVLGIVWTLNLFNFMDGIDGIAASEAIFIVGAGVSLALTGGNSALVPATGAVFAAACWGFLLWNWPPAKIFMGDVGSGFLGYVIAVLAILDAQSDPAALLVWLILGAVFFVDATVTLARRLLRGDRLHQAHRTHAYQWLARRWQGHRPVTVAVLVVDVCWLLPLAWLARSISALAPLIALIALAPLVVAAIIAGAGRREDSA